MAAPVNARMPPELDLSGGYTVRFTALDPTTGAVDTSVKVSNASLFVVQVSGAADDLSSGPFLFVAGPAA